MFKVKLCQCLDQIRSKARDPRYESLGDWREGISDTAVLLSKGPCVQDAGRRDHAAQTSQLLHGLIGGCNDVVAVAHIDREGSRNTSLAADRGGHCVCSLLVAVADRDGRTSGGCIDGDCTANGTGSTGDQHQTTTEIDRFHEGWQPLPA